MDISLAALLGDDVYNFGELLLHPIVSGWAGVTCTMKQAFVPFFWLHCATPTWLAQLYAFVIAAAPSPPLQINALKEGGYGWLHDMLECFNSGEAAPQGNVIFGIEVLKAASMHTPAGQHCCVPGGSAATFPSVPLPCILLHRRHPPL